jgi:beta-glucanase (GH16 family)
MRSYFALFALPLLLLLVACGTAAPPTETAVPPTPTPDLTRDGWTLVWHDEFDGPEINADVWTHEIGGHGWGNGENQYYTDDPDNAFIEDGMLVIQALERNYLGKPFTSARLTTQGKLTQQYGRIEARIQIPTGKGIWPAFWMLGENYDTVGWPRSGEIDIMENIGSEPWVVHGTLHGPGYSGGSGVGAAYRLPDRSPFHANFHVYAVEWEPEEIRWYVDDAFTVPSPPPAARRLGIRPALFYDPERSRRRPLARLPRPTTEFPQRMLVDYVRIYERSSQ